MEYQVSIIVAIYNVEKYLKECIESVIGQTFFNSVKLFLIDDGSTDKSSEIAKAYAEKHENISYYCKENGGQSTARNYGLKLVDTPYVMFLDSDDVLPLNACHSLYSMAVETNCPLVIGDLETFPSRTPNYLWKKYFGKGNFIINDIYDTPDLIFGPSPCNKIFNMDYLRSKDFHFPEGLTFEDAYAIIPLMLDETPIAILDEAVYHYRKREEGTSTMDNIYVKPKNYFDHLVVNERLWNLIPRDATLHQQESIYKYMIRTYNGFLTAMAGKHKEVLTTEEKIGIFYRLQKMYKKIPLYLFSNFVANQSLNLIYYSILENKLELFLEGRTIQNYISIEDHKSYIPLKRDVTSKEFITCHWSVWIDYLTIEGDHLVFYGLFNSANIAIRDKLKNEMTFYFENPKTKDSIGNYDVIFTQRKDYHSHSQALYHGIKVLIPLRDVKQLQNHNFLLKTKMYDFKTNQSITRKVIASTSLHRFKGPVKDKNTSLAYLDIYNKRGIYMQSKRSLSKRIFSQFKKIINPKKLRLKVGGKLRLLYWLSYPFLARKNIVLIGERKDTFQDNSSHLFKYVRNHHNDANWHYVIDKTSPDYEQAKKYGNVIKFDSIKHYLYLLHANKLVNSYDLESYMVPSGYSKWSFLEKFGDLLKYQRIFLQHGIVYNDISMAASKFRTAYDLVISSNTHESEFFIKDAHYKDDQIIKTGLPRYDRLSKYIRHEPLEENKQKQILLMPTWRSTLANKSYLKSSKQNGASEDQFIKSDYFQFYNEVLRNKNVHQFLKDHNAVLNFYPHYEMQDFLHLFKTDYELIRVIDNKNVKVQDLLIDHDLLITDYSSVFFDFAFMKKPVIFTQFDYETFYKTQYKEGYMKFSEQKIGPVVTNIPDLINTIKRIDSNKYKITDEQEQYSQKFFDYWTGSSISEKVYKRIID
ncbi:bifunctional glycosyltransferase/CDP-glycerol:glycerophosphate glycerophosphotransferase [Mesobacillus subterraneus]|uniref:Glycosyltransferase n=1 Tax=Mesobacillus subterraneus TaxID=285983 RepID=A0A3R9E9J2_9BACI|nr:CDP-glycerol glycerophosphotransferase family protein [Mesobacillus subterraneus]RSD26976.1 glycosyltransferase [Mesobacillus subterraneus]